MTVDYLLNERELFACPVCRGELYRGSHRGSTAYKCKSANGCALSNTPIGRTKAEVRRGFRYLSANGDHKTGVQMDVLRTVGSREIHDCPECGNRTSTELGRIAYCTRHVDGEQR